MPPVCLVAAGQHCVALVVQETAVLSHVGSVVLDHVDPVKVPVHSALAALTWHVLFEKVSWSVLLQVFLAVKLLQTCSAAQHVVFVSGCVCVLIVVVFVDQTAECWLIVVVKVSEAVAVAVVALQVVVKVVQLVVRVSLEPS
jgi:hypothetical protein